MRGALTLVLLQLAAAVSAAELQFSTKHTELLGLSPSREAVGHETQWAPFGNFLGFS